MHDLDIQQTDVDSAFPYANLQEEIYMDQLDGFHRWDNSAPGRMVCRRRKVAYGLK